MSTNLFGQLKISDQKKVKSLATFLQEKGFYCGIHGTSLWNPRYKDVDVLIFSEKPFPELFWKTIHYFIRRNKINVLQRRGDETIGYDLDLQWGRSNLHVSYVLLLN